MEPAAVEVRSGELFAALSLALDLGTGEPLEHALRTCLIGLELADRLGLPDDQRREQLTAAYLGPCRSRPHGHIVAGRAAEGKQANGNGARGVDRAPPLRLPRSKLLAEHLVQLLLAALDVRLVAVTVARRARIGVGVLGMCVGADRQIRLLARCHT